MNETIDFGCFSLLIDRHIPGKEVFAALSNETVTLNPHDDNITQLQVINEKEYIWFYGRSGTCFPYAPDVADITTQIISPNPRKANQAELRQQWFAMYSFSTETLYLSDKGKTILRNYLSQKLGKRVDIKNVYKDKNKFLEELESIKSIRFVARHDLLTSQSDIFQNVSNDLGLGNPNQLKLNLDYSYAKKTVKFVNYVKGLFSKYESGCLTGLVIVGAHTEKDTLMESVFNIKSIGESIHITCEKDEMGMYSPDIVKAKLYGKLSLEN